MNKPIYRWINQGLVNREQQQEALQLAGERPCSSAWMLFINKLLLLLGLLSFAFGVVFFFAYNWNELGRMSKFMILQLLLTSIFVAYYFKSKSFWIAQTLLFTGVIVLGALLALFGQTYQTGADPWQLFSTWALLITPLVLLARSEVLWAVWAVLLNTALALYLHLNNSLFGLIFHGHHFTLLFMVMNFALLSCVECFSNRQAGVFIKVALRYRWIAQVLGVWVVTILGYLGVQIVVDSRVDQSFNSFVYVVFMSGLFAYYRFIKKDLLLLTAWALALILFILTLLANTVLDDFDAGALLLMAVSLIAMSTLAVSWIKNTHEIFN